MPIQLSDFRDVLSESKVLSGNGFMGFGKRYSESRKMKEAENIRTEFVIFGRHIIFWVILGLLCSLCPARVRTETSTPVAVVDEDELADDSLIGMDIEKLMEINVRPTATLTRTSQKMIPAAMTIITKEDIENSGARSVDEVLDMYVPNLQMILHIWEMHHLGLRGTISDRDDKYLLLVNGRVMNDRMHYGAMSERDLPMLGDINRIEVVRGPGSAMYGPGALFMVINIITDSPRTFEGTEIRTRLGAIDEFYTWEAKWGKHFKDDSGVLLYAGVDKQPGTDSRQAPFTPGMPYTYLGQNFNGTEPSKLNQFSGYNRAYRDLCKLKFYGQYSKDDFDFWARYTRGGYHYPMWVGDLGSSDALMPGEGYQQLTFYIGDKKEVSKTVNVDYSFSYDTFDFERMISSDILSHRQDEYHTKVILHWQPHENHSIAVGGEYSHEEFGIKSPGFPDMHADSYAFEHPGSGLNPIVMPRWATDTSSVLGEYQWKVFPQWTIFLGGRIDWHRFVKREMFSPRGAVVYTPTDKDTLKLIIQRSTRASTAENMKLNYDLSDDLSDYETMDYYEMRWERQHTKNLWIAGSGFYTLHNVIAWSQDSYAVAPLGEVRIYGAEIEAIYKTGKAKFTASHGYTKLDGMKLKDSDTVQFLTAEPYGIGHDLSSWHNNVTKFTGHYDITDKWSIDGSLNIYWGIPGRKDYARYNDTLNPGTYTYGFESPFRESMYMNLGMGYKFSDNCKVRVTAHNILGWVDRDYNKRNYAFGDTNAAVTNEAPSISVSLEYRF
jgi:outer membrane receptor for ferrienterochelin and colicin